MKVLANLGLVIFMFIIGLELDLKLIKGNERRAGVISISSILVPFVGGALLALWLYNDHSQGGLLEGHHVKKLAFALFIGASMCVTAFPVLARILNERGMTRTPLGVIALACAAIDDVVAWSLLAFVSAIAGSTSEPVWEVFAYLALYIAVMFGIIKPLLARYLLPLYQRAGRLTPDVLAILLAGLLLSAWMTDHIGVHFIFGAFVFGIVLPREGTAGALPGDPRTARAGQRPTAASDLLHRHWPLGRPHEADRQQRGRALRRAGGRDRRQVHRRLSWPRGHKRSRAVARRRSACC